MAARRKNNTESQKRKTRSRAVNSSKKIKRSGTGIRNEGVTAAFPSGSQDSTNNKRSKYLSWDQFFMGVAFVAAQRSKDPVTQVGACIVNKEKRIISTGYNGMPNRCSDKVMHWGKPPEIQENLKNKKLYVCHAEMNAVLNKTSADVNAGTMYVTLHPCNECAKIIIQANIKKVVYFDDSKCDKDETKAAKFMFDVAQVKTRKYKPNNFLLKIEEPNTETNKVLAEMNL